MTTPCPIQNVELIFDQENIGDSLPKINNNFKKLEELTKLVRNEISTTKNIRTFFYYGPNYTQGNNGTSGMDNGNPSRPSDTTIQNFVNNTLDLNEYAISNVGDIVYVIYQKTGWLKSTSTVDRTGSVTATFSKVVTWTEAVRVKIGIGRYRIVYVQRSKTVYQDNSLPWTANLSETYNRYAPVFIIYKLTFNGSNYLVDPDFPKYSYATTGNSVDWNNPQNWTRY